MKREMQKLFEAAHEITEFCFSRRGKCFGGWTREKIFAYIAHSILEKHIFIVKVKDKVKAIAIAKPTGEGRLIFYEVIGGKSACRQMFSQIMQRWPDVKRFFAFRQHAGKTSDLEELDAAAILRFTT